MTRTFYYARVSTREQNLDRQIQAFKSMGATDADIITDKASGKDTDRAGYLYMRQSLLRDGDTLVIKSLDRLSRNKADIAKELLYYREHGIRVKILDLPTTAIDIDSGNAWAIDMVNGILIELLSSLAEHEREQIHQRQREGIEAMRIDDSTGKRVSNRTGRTVGRPSATLPSNWEQTIAAWRAGEITAVEAMRRTGTKRSTFYKMVSKCTT